MTIYSDSDVAGITIAAVETTENSGSFTATISLSSTTISSGNRLYALPGDNIYTKYDDHTLPKPYSTSDSLEIETFSIINSSISSLERLENESITFSDNLGNQLESFTPNNQIQIVGTINNDTIFNQKFVFLIQVKNESNSVVSISWIQGELSSNQQLQVSQSWIPKTSGQYGIETFVWDSTRSYGLISFII